MHPLKQMQKLLTTPTIKQGTLIRREGSQLFVSTERGVKAVTQQMNDATNYAAGDQIRFAGEVVLGKRRPPKATYVL